MVADDSAAVRLVLKGLLEEAGVRVVQTVANGSEALNALRHHQPDLLCLDVNMPVMDGLDATHRIRDQEISTGCHIPIIAMTANAMQGDRENCLNAGMDDYLAKPINAADLNSKLATIARRKYTAQSLPDQTPSVN